MERIHNVKLFILIVSFISLAYCQDDMLKLIRSENCYLCFKGYHDKREVLIQVKNVAYEKQVFVHHKMNDGSWIDFPAHYERPGNSTYELWHFDTICHPIFGDEFVLKYVVLGQTFWDNNNGTNYTLENSSQSGPGPMLGSYINVLLKSASIIDGQLHAYIDVRNIAYAKNVALTYTTNNWASSTTIQANYLSTISTGPCSYNTFPNAYNIERWGLTSTIPTVPIQFYLSYTVDGQTYYDNNYWSNYVLSN